MKDELEAFPIEHFVELEKHGVSPELIEELQKLELTNGKTIKIEGEAPNKIKK